MTPAVELVSLTHEDAYCFIPHSPHFGGAEKQLIELVRSIEGQQDCLIWYDPVDWRDLIKLKPRVVVFSKGIADIYP